MVDLEREHEKLIALRNKANALIKLLERAELEWMAQYRRYIELLSGQSNMAEKHQYHIFN